MSLPKKKDGVNGLIAVAVNNEKESHRAFKWAIDNLLTRNANVILIHVKILAPDAEINANDNDDDSLLICKEPDADALYMFLPYCVFCTRKYVSCISFTEKIKVKISMLSMTNNSKFGDQT